MLIAILFTCTYIIYYLLIQRLVKKGKSKVGEFNFKTKKMKRKLKLKPKRHFMFIVLPFSLIIAFAITIIIY